MVKGLTIDILCADEAMFSRTCLGKLEGTNLSRPSILLDIAKLFGVMFFYGLVLSLLGYTWQPLSLEGVILFFSMTIAYGLVGIVDDILQWRAILRWNLPADLTVRPPNILLAVTSTTARNLFSLVPA
jgi:UDP-N-acetylmuramyl pentapeptide phosphotransferase/UDP-N-acetylglucosamine-1-phosphate transferase